MRTSFAVLILVAFATCALGNMKYSADTFGQNFWKKDFIQNIKLSESSQPAEESPLKNLDGYVEHPDPFGSVYLRKDFLEGSDSIVTLPAGGLFSDPQHYKDLQDAFLFHENNKDVSKEMLNDALITCDRGDKPDYFKLAPEFLGTLSPQNTSFNHSAACFQNNQISFTIQDANTVVITHIIDKPADLTCTDAYFYSILPNFHIEIFDRRGTHTVNLKMTDDQMKMVTEVGIDIFRFCDKTVYFYPDLIKTIMLFLGGLGLNPNIPFAGSKPTEKQVEDNVKFIYEATGYQWQERPKDAQNVVYELDESLIQSGDFIAIIRFDGLDPIIGYGSGSHVGHCTMALRVDGELYIVESQSGWYWPRTGIQMNPYKQWVEWANDAGFHTTWLPLKKEIADQFNSTAAYEYFKTIEGLPYGYHNFLYGWLDTPDHNYPPLLAPQLIAPLFSVVERINASAADMIFNMGLNKRLDTENLTIAQIALEAANRNLTMPDLYAMVEVDGWEYPDGVSYVCSAFVTAMHKAGGLYGSLNINAVEFTPKDVYEMSFFDTNPTIPDDCKALDPANPFCQIMGKYRMEFPRMATVSPYDHMNEKCWTEGTDYLKTPQGC